jgi:hypothetical protein
MTIKRIALLLAVITILQIVPSFVLPVGSVDEEIDVSEMEVGKLYRAIFKTKEETGWSDIYVYNQSMEQFHTTIVKSTLPQELIVKKVEEGDVVVYVTNEVWSSTTDGNLDEYRYVEAHELHILEKIEEEPVVPDDGLVRGEVGLVIDGEVVETLTVAKGDRVYLFTELSDLFVGTPIYTWQLLINRESNSWATVQDYVYPYAAVSEALIANARLENGKATMRCVVTYNGVRYVSGEVDIVIDYESTPAEPPVLPEEVLSVTDAQIPQFEQELEAFCKAIEENYNGENLSGNVKELSIDPFEVDFSFYVTNSEATDTKGYVNTNYTVDNGNVVMVTYKKGTETVNFILNYNSYAVTVRMNGEQIPVGSYAYEIY